MALNARPAASGASIGYQEEIFHPSQVAPVVARGWFEFGDDGALIRHQTEPQVETVEIGEHFIHQRRESDGASNSVRISSELAPLLGLLRMVIARDEDVVEMSNDHVLDLEPGDNGWTLTLATDRSDDTSSRLVLGGCGDVLRSVELQLPDNSRRRYVFENAP